MICRYRRSKSFFPVLMICIVCLLWGSPNLYGKTLDSSPFQLLSLDTMASPTVLLAPQADYSSSLLQSLSKEAPKGPLHIAVPISTAPFNPMSWFNTIGALKKLDTEVTLSLIPGAGLSDEAYRAICNEFYSLTKKNVASNVHLIWYPQEASNFPLYDVPEAWGIGVSVEKTEDLSFLDALYTHFEGQKPLFIQDHMMTYYKDKTSLGLAALNSFYYTLGVKYPEVAVVFSSYDKLKSDSPYLKFYTGLLEESWISPLNVGDKTWMAPNTPTTSAYSSPIPSAPVRKGNKFLVWSSDDSYKAIHCMQYRFNGEVIANAFTYPYVAAIDADKLYNGMGRLTLSAFDSSGRLLWSQTQDLSIEGDLVGARAPRTTPIYSLEQKPTYTTDYIPVLMYHVFSEEVKASQQFIAVDISLFEAQLEALLENGYTPISFYDLDQYLKEEGGLPEKPILITADDGYLDNYTLAFPILEKYSAPATFFVPPAHAGVDTGNLHFDWQQAQEMEASGLVDIQIHGYDHTPFNNLSLEDVYYQISCAQGIIEKYLGTRDVVAVSYPEFRHTADTQALLSEMGVAFQTTDNARKGSILRREDVKRINVPNSMSPEKLIATLESLTD